MRDAHREVVRDGYDQVGHRYLDARTSHEGEDLALLAELLDRLNPGNVVLDAGCGAGTPVMARLVEAELEPVGLDLSGSQLALAQSRVPDASLVQADLAALPFGDRCFDAVVSYYAVIHVPRSEHLDVIGEFRRVLRPGGLGLLCLGAGDLPEDYDSTYFGAPMFWSHFDASTNLHMLRDAGFEVLWDRLVADPLDEASHLFALARCR
jgi:ubiquinone/menaquinone biosynthesis C-methylase UbiE